MSDTPIVYHSIAEAEALSTYSGRQLRRMCVDGKIKAERCDVTGDWLIPSPELEPHMRPEHRPAIPSQKYADLDTSDLTPKQVKKARIAWDAVHVSPTWRKDEWVGKVAKDHGISKATVYRYIERYIREGNGKTVITMPEFDPEEHYKIDFGNVKEFSVDFLKWAVGERLSKPKNSLGYVFSQAKKEAKKAGWKYGSKPRFYKHMEKIPQALFIKAEKGDRGVEIEINAPIRRNYSTYRVMETVVMDQLLSDFYVYDDLGRIISPQFYVCMDMASSYITGIAPTIGNYNKYTIGKAIRLTCDYGIAPEWYSDNGKPELSNHVKYLLAQLHGAKYMDFDNLPGDLKITRAKPRNSKAKPIESTFSHIQRRELDLSGGLGYKKYLKNGTDEEMQAQLKRDLKAGRLLHYSQYFENLMKCIRWWNNHVIKDRGYSPQARFTEELSTSPAMRMRSDTLDLIFLPQAGTPKRGLKITNSCARFRIEGVTVEYHHPALSKYQNRYMDVRYNPEDIDQVYILDPESCDLVCMAEPLAKVGKDDFVALRERMKAKGEMLRWWRETFRHYTDRVEGPNTIRMSPYAKAGVEAAAKKKAQKKQLGQFRMTSRDIDRMITSEKSSA